ncbi:hypothetical protein D477_020908, partial [Arthrobacter crystallopoietes BAB-32]
MSHASAFDFRSAATGVVFQDKPLATLSPWLAKSRAAAGQDGLQFTLVTPSSTAVSLPLGAMLAEPGCQWLATTAEGTFFDGFTGRVHQWDGAAFQPLDEIGEDFLLTPALPSGLVHVRAETMHPASHSTRIGGFTAQLFTELTGAAPTGWGVAEPVSEPWDEAAVTAHCFERAPETAFLVVVGHPRVGTAAPVIAVVTVERSFHGVHESVELLVESPEPLDAGQLDSFSARMHRNHARTAVLGHALAFSSLARPARFTGVSVPACAVFGPEALQDYGADAALAAAGPRARL